MGERPDQIRRPAIGEDPNFDPATGAFDPDVTRTHAFDDEVLHPGTTTNGPEAASTVEIERSRVEIERTRADMSETVDAIQERLSPENIKEQAKDRVKEATVGKAKGAGNSIVEAVKENPLPAAIAGLSLGWIFAQARKRSTSPPLHAYNVREYDENPVAYDRVRYVEGSGGSDGSSVGGAVSRARDKVGETAGHAQERVGEGAATVQHKAGSAANKTRNQLSQLGERTKNGASRASNGFGRMLQENPLAVGALAAGVGAAVGLAIPETSKENEVMGEARDNLVNKAQEKAQETQEKVQQVAQEAQGAAQQEAQNQGLTNE